MNIDKITSEKIIEIGKLEYPVVIFENKEIAYELIDFLKYKRKISDVFGKILSQFGYTKEDVVVLKNLVYDKDGISFNYVVNDIEDMNNKITLNFATLVFNNSMVIKDKDNSVKINTTVFNYKDIRLRIKEVENRLDDGRVYTRVYAYDSANYSIKVGDRKINLQLSVPLRYGNVLMNLDKDQELENYLKGIQLPISIDTVYKDIEGYLGDIKTYLEIKLEMSTVKNNESEVTDLLVLNNGECSEFMITRGKRRVHLNQKGEWVYNYSDEFCSVSTVEKELEDVTYSISASNDIVLREIVLNDGVNAIDNAIDSVDDTKALVMRMFPTRRNNRW